MATCRLATIPVTGGFRAFADDDEHARATRVQGLEWGGDAPYCGRSPLAAADMQDARTADMTIWRLKEHRDAACRARGPWP